MCESHSIIVYEGDDDIKKQLINQMFIYFVVFVRLPWDKKQS